MQIPKFIKDIKKYFMYEGSAAPTTQDDLQAYMKNEHETLACLVDGLWQPETEYQEGHIVRSPNMPKGIDARVKKGGYSATNEPDWNAAATEISDGAVIWEKIARFNNIEVTGDVTGNGIVDNAGQVALDLELPDKVVAGTVGDTIEANLGSGATFTVPYLTVDEKGRVTNYDKRNLTLPVSSSFAADSDLNVSQSTQPSLDYLWPFNIGRNKYTGTYVKVDTGIGSGSYTLQNLLQQLVNKSHTHSTKSVTVNCNCDCGDDGGCFIDADILTTKGYINIKDLKTGDYIIYDKKKYRVAGIAKNKLGKRKAVSLDWTEKLLLTEDHLFKLPIGAGAYDIDSYFKSNKMKLYDNKVVGSYQRKLSIGEKFIPLKDQVTSFFDYNHEIFLSRLQESLEYDENTVTYSPIVEDCEWCIANGVVVACGRRCDSEC